MTTMTNLTRTEEQKLARFRDQLREEARTAALAGLEDRAERLREEARQVAERVQAALQRRREEAQAQRRAKAAAQERHDKMMAEREREVKRQAAAAKWLRTAITRMGAQPQPADSLLQMADAAGHDPADIEAISVRVRSRKEGHEPVPHLAVPGRFLLRDWLEIDKSD